MATRRESTERLYTSIRKEYEKLKNIKSHGVQRYSEVFIVSKLADKFFKSQKTIENIVYFRT